MAQQDWRAELAARFDKLGATAAAAPAETKIDNTLRCVKCLDGRERIKHVLVQPHPCSRCGQGETGTHRSESQCIVELKRVLSYATANVQIIRR